MWLPVTIVTYINLEEKHIHVKIKLEILWLQILPFCVDFF